MNKGNPTGKRIQNVSGRKKVDLQNNPLFRINIFTLLNVYLHTSEINVLCFNLVILEIFSYC